MLITIIWNRLRNSSSRDVYLPDGEWFDYETGEKFYGPTTLEAYSLPVNKIPIFIGGKGVVVSKASQKSGNLNLKILPIANAGSQYRYTYIDGETTSTITNNNDGWNLETIVITNTTTDEPSHANNIDTHADDYNSQHSIVIHAL